MNFSPISGLGYVVVRTSAIDAWKSYATDLLGLMPSKMDRPDGSFAYRMDDRLTRLILEPGENGVAATGWDVASETDWADLQARLAKAGVVAETISGVEAERRGAVELLRVTDPGGEVVEFAHQPLLDPVDSFVSHRGLRFVTGDQGMGHITRAVENFDATVAFYHDVLGMQVRETQSNKAIRSSFLGPNPRHHSIALIDIRARPMNMFHHLLLEVDSVDDLGRSLDLARKAGHLKGELGRHFNDLMLSFYMNSPSGLQVEVGYDGRRIDSDSWVEYRQGGKGGASLWGHHPVTVQAAAKEVDGLAHAGLKPAHA